MKKYLFIFLIFSGMLSSCVDPYWPELDKYENTLVVDGLITNEPGPYFIRLQLSATIYQPVFQPLSDASVYITDDLGNVENFHETEKGVYSNTNQDFQGIVGRSYQLTISLSENQVYHSDWERIPLPLGIDSVYAEIEEHIEENQPNNLLGYQFYIDTKKSSNDSTYLIWRLQGTYKYTSDFKCAHIYTGKMEIFPKFDSLMTCWKTEMVPRILIGTTQGSEEDQLIRYPLHFVSTEGRELSIRYSVLVNQYVVNENVYKYWKALQDQNDIQGSLYTQQPYQIRGNMININNSAEPIVGCFIAAGIDKKRIYFDRPDVDFNYPICTIGEADYMNMMDLTGLPPSFWPVYLAIDANNVIVYPNQDCIDCRQKGGKLEKPDFWIE